MLMTKQNYNNYDNYNYNKGINYYLKNKKQKTKQKKTN